MRTSIPLFALLAALALSSAGCHGAMEPDEALAAIHDPNPHVRQHAADSLRNGGVVPADAIPHLLQALQTEPEPYVRGAIVITLGWSGAPQVKPVIDQAVASAATINDQRWAGRALKAWMIQSGQLPANVVLPAGWPYGQPGYPALLVK